MADTNGNNRKVANDGDNHNNNNKNHLPDKEVEEKNHLPDKEVEEKKNDVNGDKDVAKGDDGVEDVDTDNNNNSVANHGAQASGGAAALPDPDVVMVEVGRALANTITRAVEDTVSEQRTWLVVHMPDGERGLIGFGQKTTVETINARLAAQFGPRVYFFGFRLVTGLVFSAPLRYTVEDVDELKSQFGIGSFAEDWYEED